MSDTDPDQEATDGFSGFSISLGEFGYITKKYKKQLKDYQDAQAAADAADVAFDENEEEEEEPEEGEEQEEGEEKEGEEQEEGEEKESDANIAPRLPNDFPTAWAKCSISVNGSANTDDIWHPVDQATKAGIPKFFPLQEHGGFEMTRSSKQFQLTSANMQLLSLITIDITIYQGNMPGDKKDTIIGTVSVPMMDVLKDGSINGKMALELHEGEKKPYEVVVAITLDPALATYARRGRFFSFAELTLDVPLPLLVSGHAKFELHVGTIDALVADPSAPVPAKDAMWTIAGGTVPEGNVPETEGDKGKGKSKAKPKKEEPKGKKGKKKQVKEAPVETKEPTPEKKKKKKELKPAQAVWPSPAFSFFMAEETLDNLLNMSITQSTLELPLSVVRVSSGHDGSTVPEVLDGTLDIAAMCQVDCRNSDAAIALTPVVSVPATVDEDGVPLDEAKEVQCVLSCSLRSDPALLSQEEVPAACSQDPLDVISVPEDPPKKDILPTTGEKLDIEVDKIIAVVLEQCNNTETADTPDQYKAFRREVFQQLNVSGNYFRFKESIKVAMIRDAQARAKAATAKAKSAGKIPTDGESKVTSDEFVCRFYSQLMQHVHRRLNGSVDKARVEVRAKLRDERLTEEQYQTLVLEGKHSGNWDLTRDVCERYVRDFPKSLWGLVMLGNSCLQIEEFSRASDVLQRAVKLVCEQPTEDPELEMKALCMYGVLLLVETAPDEAEVCFNEVLKRQINSGTHDQSKMDVLVALLGLAHATRESADDERCLFVQWRCLARQPRRATLALVAVADMLIANGLPELAGTAVTMADSFITQMKTKSDGVTLRLHIARARQFFAVGQYEDSADHANKALQIDSESAEAAEVLGHVYYASGYGLAGAAPGKKMILEDEDEDGSIKEEVEAFYLQAKANYELCVRHYCAVDAEDVPLLVYNRLGQIYLMQRDLVSAKEVYLRVCSRCQSASSWLGVATACIRGMELPDAEKALSQANRLDKTNPNVWGNLALVQLMSDESDVDGLPPTPTLGGRPSSVADKCLSYALKFNLSDPELLSNIAFYYLGRLDLATAEKLLRLSIQYDGANARVHEALAEVLRRTKRDNEALVEYRRACSLFESYEDKSRLGILISAFGEGLGV